jgi:signal transduction histidine kinase
MLKEQFNRMSVEQKSLVAVAYLMSNSDKQPEELKKLFLKLINYDKIANNINEAINQAKKSINELRPKLEQTIGSITALSGVIADSMPMEHLEEYCLAYDMPQAVNDIVRTVAPENTVDFAGATAKKLPDPEKK